MSLSAVAFSTVAALLLDCERSAHLSIKLLVFNTRNDGMKSPLVGERKKSFTSHN